MPTWSISEVRTVFQRSGGRCHVCKRVHALGRYRQDWNMDHLQPKSQGGSNDVRNLAVACISCNSRKGNNFDMSDLVAGVSNEVVDRLQNSSTGHNRISRARSGGRGSGLGGGYSGGSRQDGNRRKGRCSLCEEVRPLIGSFCNNCNKKSQNRPIQKREGECAYGRCTQPVKSRGFLGLGSTAYCERHQNQHDRGLI